MDIVDIIRTKRDAELLSAEEIRWFIERYTAGDGVSDEQAAALLMAIFFNGLDADELHTWTAAMIDSGERLDLRGVGRPTVDKHSTGGVGDKLSLIVVPMLAACGAAVPQLSGRGLGHTGGTLDKMEAIPGWRAMLTNAEMVAQLSTVGAIIAGAHEGLAPADRLLYALRDVTATVASIPLIASSIMSKKIAEGTDALVLDVKVGTGAFMGTLDDARELAHRMIDLGRTHGVATSAVLTDMNTVLGRAVGNAIEVQESLDVLDGGGPADVVELSIALAREMARLAGVDRDPAETLTSGEARRSFEEMVAAQGGDLTGLPEAEHQLVVEAPRSGVVASLEARNVGVAAWRLGAGRAQKTDPVSPVAGVFCHGRPGDRLEAGQPLFTLHADDPARFSTARELVLSAVTIADAAPEAGSSVIEILRS